jgi:hypothetical protein
LSFLSSHRGRVSNNFKTHNNRIFEFSVDPNLFDNDFMNVTKNFRPEWIQWKDKNTDIFKLIQFSEFGVYFRAPLPSDVFEVAQGVVAAAESVANLKQKTKDAIVFTSNPRDATEKICGQKAQSEIGIASIVNFSSKL